MSLPPNVIAPLAQFVGHMEQERNIIAQLPEAQVATLVQQVLAQPAPMTYILPPVQPQPEGGPGSTGGWSTNSAGAIWGSGDGRATYMRFEGGGSIGMVGNKLVGAGI